jgi:hypothetical protein
MAFFSPSHIYRKLQGDWTAGTRNISLFRLSFARDAIVAATAAENNLTAEMDWIVFNYWRQPNNMPVDPFFNNLYFMAGLEFFIRRPDSSLC